MKPTHWLFKKWHPDSDCECCWFAVIVGLAAAVFGAGGLLVVAYLKTR